MANQEIVAGKQLAVDGQKFTKFQALLKDWLAAKAEADAAKAKEAHAKAKMDEWMKEKGHERVAALGYRVDRTITTTRRFNSKAFQKDNHKLYEQYRVPSESVRMSVTKYTDD